MSNAPANPPANPLANPEPWDSVSPAYTAEILPLFEKFSQDALDRAELPDKSRIVDVATGPGTLALLAAERGAAVSAIDFSEQMLAQFRKRARPELLARIDLRKGDGQKLPFESETFDAAFSMFGLIFFPDRIAGFRELRRVLKPGARRAIVSSWAPFEGAYALVMDVIRAHVPGIPFGQGQAPLGAPEMYHKEMGEAGFSKVQVDTIAHVQNVPSVAEFWGNVQRTNVGLILLRRKLGQEQWARTEPSIFAQLQKEFGAGPMAITARAHLGIGIR